MWQKNRLDITCLKLRHFFWHWHQIHQKLQPVNIIIIFDVNHVLFLFVFCFFIDHVSKYWCSSFYFSNWCHDSLSVLWTVFTSILCWKLIVLKFWGHVCTSTILFSLCHVVSLQFGTNSVWVELPQKGRPKVSSCGATWWMGTISDFKWWVISLLLLAIAIWDVRM